MTGGSDLEHWTVPGSGIELEALVCRPARSAPLVVVVHGWGGGAESMTTLGGMVSAAGYGVALLSMRGWGRSGGRDDAGLEQPDDIVIAVGALAAEPWVLGGVVGLLGVSQGGQVALLAAARGARVAAVAAWAPVTDLDRWRATTSEPGIVDYLDRTVGTDTRRRSPVDAASSISAPVLLVHGDADTRVPKEQSELLATALRQHGRHVELQLLPGIGHGGPDALRRGWDATASFFQRHLGDASLD